MTNSGSEGPDVDTDSYQAMLDGLYVGRGFRRRLLLALMDATLLSEAKEGTRLAEREARLDAAMAAVFGEKAARGARERVDTEPLLYMAQEHKYDDYWVNSYPRIREHLRELGTKTGNEYAQRSRSVNDKVRPKKVRSMRELARAAARKFYPHEVKSRPNDRETATEKRLRDRFSNEKEYWLELEGLQDGVPETFEAQMLAEIAEVLRKAGIPMVFESAGFDARYSRQISADLEVIGDRVVVLVSPYNPLHLKQPRIGFEFSGAEAEVKAHHLKEVLEGKDMRIILKEPEPK